MQGDPADAPSRKARHALQLLRFVWHPHPAAAAATAASAGDNTDALPTGQHTVHQLMKALTLKYRSVRASFAKQSSFCLFDVLYLSSSRTTVLIKSRLVGRKRQPNYLCESADCSCSSAPPPTKT